MSYQLLHKDMTLIQKIYKDGMKKDTLENKAIFFNQDVVEKFQINPWRKK